MNGIVRVALQRPLTFIVMALMILIFGGIAAVTTPADIFPDIKIPSIAVAWQYTGLSADDMGGRVMMPFEQSQFGFVEALSAEAQAVHADGFEHRTIMCVGGGGIDLDGPFIAGGQIESSRKAANEAMHLIGGQK